MTRLAATSLAFAGLLWGAPQLPPTAVTAAGSTPLKRVGTITTANVSRTNVSRPRAREAT